MTIRALITGGIVGLGVVALIVWQQDTQFGAIDLLEYWGASRLFWDGGNPYSAVELLTLQQSVFTGTDAVELPIRMYNPPHIFPLILFLALLDFTWAATVWFLLSLGGFVISALLIQREVSRYHSPTEEQKLLLLVTVASWYPLFLCLGYGQISFLLSLGLALFLGFRRHRPVLSGIGLSLTFIKPHLLWLLYLALVRDGRRSGTVQVLLGCGLGLAVLVGIAGFLRPDMFALYAQMEGVAPVNFLTPTVGSWLTVLHGAPSLPLRILPTCVAAVIALIFFRGGESEHLASLAWLIPLSLLLSPYGWGFDFVLCLPTLVVLIFSASPRGARLVTAALFCANCALYAPGSSVGQHTLIWYLCLLILLVGISPRGLSRDKPVGHTPRATFG